MLATSAILASAPPERASAAPAPQVAEAGGLFLAGKAASARALLENQLAAPAANPAERLDRLRPLLDICLLSGDSECVGRHAPAFLLTARQQAAVIDGPEAARLALEAAYYFDAARLRSGVAPREILAGQSWKNEIAYDGELYLRRQVLASNLYLESGDQAGLDRSLGKILSLIGSLKNPEAASLTVAVSLADVLATLLDNGQTERAWGLYRASGGDIARALPPLSLDAALFALTVGKLNAQVGETAAARAALDAAAAILRRIELSPTLKASLLAETLTLHAALDGLAGDRAAAAAALAGHPFAALYAEPGRSPESVEEVAYLTARVFVAAGGGQADTVAATALQKPFAFKAEAESQEAAAAYRAAGLALALPAGVERQRRLLELARRLQVVYRREDAAGSLDRIGVIDQLLIALALSSADAARTGADAEAMFTLFQLANRTGTTFDADALAALSQAKDELQRRTLHQALRLRARRDRLERERIQAVTAAMLRPFAAERLQHDVAARRRLRDFAERLAAAEARLAADGLSLRGPRLVELGRLQAALGPDEAALAVAPSVGGLAYLCVRRDASWRHAGPIDAGRLRLDVKLLQASLTAGHAPSEALDVQFPAAAAVRLYDGLVRPFEACLKPADRIVWMSGVADLGLPLAVLLPSLPPKLGAGYDLAAADWLVRRHALSYAGSAAVIAARSTAGRAMADFDFLGVGDPQLDGPTAQLVRGVRGGGRFAGLAPLPETRRELEASARGFSAARILAGEGATEGAVRSQVLGDYRYLSFATHGLLREDLQGLSEPALVLTPRSAEPGDDGLLTASEIADMNLHASFVALSACNTANFELDAMVQDLPALASAFAVSGVPATLGTLWPVDSGTGETVVSGLFARLRQAGVPPAEALAQAQRAFLASPPGRAYLHPRFWAPFVVLGDGTATPAPPSGAAPALRSAEVLTSAGGEVVALAQTPQGVAAGFIAGPDASGRSGAGVRLAAAEGEAWRRVDRETRASRVLARLGATLVAGGYGPTANGRLAARLQAYDLAGRPGATWRGDGLFDADAGIVAAAPSGANLLIAVAERSPGGRLRVLETAAELDPKPLFELRAPADAQLSGAALAMRGEQVLVAYTTTELRPADPPPSLEDYDLQACAARRVTHLELRELAGGRVLKSRTLPDVEAVAALSVGGTTLLAGSKLSGCEGERQALVMALETDLEPRTLYLDASLGASQVRALAPLADGQVFVAAYKEALVDYAPAGAASAGRSYSTLAFTMDARGRRSPVKLLDTGADVLPTALLAPDGRDVLLGGALAGRAALFRFTVRPSP